MAGYGGRLVTVLYRDDAEDPDALVAAAHEHRPKLVFLANPDNPMGSWHEGERIAAILDALPDGTVLVLDEAYAEFAPEGTAMPWDTGDPRVIRFRTFSKAFGLAGLRVGYAVTHPEIAAAYDRVRNHFGVSRIAQEAAMAALGDADHLVRVVADVAGARRRIGEIAAANGLRVLPSATNFVAVDCGRDGDYARAVLRELIARDLFVRMPGVAPLDRCIRISAGREPDLALLAQALPEAIATAG